VEMEYLIPYSMQGNPSKCSLIDSQDPFTLEYAGLSLSIDRRSARSDAVGFQPLFLELWIFATTRPAHANIAGIHDGYHFSLDLQRADHQNIHHRGFSSHRTLPQECQHQ